MPAIIIPNTFLPSTTISSSAMNQNFGEVADGIEASLALDGTGAMTGQLKAVSGTAALPAFTFSLDGNTGIYRHGADELGFATNGAAAGFFDAAGKLWLLQDLDIVDDLDIGGDMTIDGTLTVTGVVIGTGAFSGTSLSLVADATLMTLRRSANNANAERAILFERGSGAGIDAYLDLKGDASNGVTSIVLGVNAHDVLDINDLYVGYFRQMAPGEQALTDGASIAWDLSFQMCARVTLAGNRTLSAPSNMRAGGTYALRIIQDATGSRTMAFNAAYKFPGGVDPLLSTAANAVDVMTCYTDGTSLYCVLQKAFA